MRKADAKKQAQALLDVASNAVMDLSKVAGSEPRKINIEGFMILFTGTDDKGGHVGGASLVGSNDDLTVALAGAMASQPELTQIILEAAKFASHLKDKHSDVLEKNIIESNRSRIELDDENSEDSEDSEDPVCPDCGERHPVKGSRESKELVAKMVTKALREWMKD